MQDSLVAPLKVVCVLDPAIDWETSDVSRYVDTRDASLIRAKPGMTLTWAVLRPLAIEDFASLDALSQGSAKLLQAFRSACTAVEGAGDGGRALAPQQRIQRGNREIVVWGEAELNDLVMRFGMQFVYEIGNVAYERAVQGNGWGGGVRYTLPQSSALGLNRISLPRAAQSPTSPGTGFSETSSLESTPSPAATSGEAGGVSAANGAAVPAAT